MGVGNFRYKIAKKVQLYGIISVIIWCGVIIPIGWIPVLAAKIAAFICLLILEKQAISKFLFYIEKLKVIERKASHTCAGDNVTKKREYEIGLIYIESVESEFCQVEITEATHARSFTINRVLLQELMIEDLIVIEDLFVVLNDGNSLFSVKTKSWTGAVQTETDLTIYKVMQKYEDSLCRHKLRNVTFEYIDPDGNVDKIVRFDNKGQIEITFDNAERAQFDRQISVWKENCHESNIVITS